MATGDGLLARIHPPLGRLSPRQAAGVAAAARICGNGQIDVTGRANLQLRGLREAARGELATRMEDLGLLEPFGPGPHRLTIVSPLAGIDPDQRVDAAALADAIEAAGRGIAGLPVKTAVAVDGGGAFSLDDVPADIRVAATPDGQAAIGLACGSGTLWIGSAELTAVQAKVQGLLLGLARLAQGRGIRRVADLSPAERHGLAAAAGDLAPAALVPDRPPGPRAGPLATAGGRTAILAGLPFGRCNADQLSGMADLADRLGEGTLRLSVTRGILLPLADGADIAAACAAIVDLGLIGEPDDPRLAVNACPGTPACASGFVPAAADAARLARAARAFLADGASLHVSGCPKGCARPVAADLTLVGRPGGRYGIVLSGTARESSEADLPLSALEACLAGTVRRADLASRLGTRP